MYSPIGVPKIAPELGIFKRKDLVFFPSKVFSRAYRHVGGEKNRKKKSIQKSGWVSMGSPFSHILPFSYRFYVRYFFFIIHAKKNPFHLVHPEFDAVSFWRNRFVLVCIISTAGCARFLEHTVE